MALGTRSLKKGELVVILGEIYRNRETGTLVLQRDDVSKFLYAQDGQLIFAASNAAEDKFTEILVQKGKLTADQLAIAMEKKEGRTIGRTLVEMGFLASSDLLEALIDQMRKVAVSTANWAAGRAVFKAGVLPQNLAKLPVSTPRFIIDTALAVEDREWAASALGQLEAPLTISQAEKDVLSAVTLTKQESGLVEHVDGQKNAREICETTAVDLFTGARFLIGLSQLGLVHLKQVMAPTPPSRHAREKVEIGFLDEAAPPEPPELPNREAPPAAGGDASGTDPGGLPFEAGTGDGASLTSSGEPPAGGPEPDRGGARTKPASGSLFPDLIFPDEDKKGATGDSGDMAEDGDETAPKDGSRRWIFILAAAVVVAACAGAAVWYFFLRETPYVPMEASRPAHTKMAEKVPSEKTPEAQPKAEASPEATGETAGARAAAPPAAGPTGTTPAARTAPAPTPRRSSPPSAPPAAGNPADQGRTLLAQGRYKEAALAFQSAVRASSDRFAIDVEVACQPETIQKDFAESGGDHRYMILPYDLHGRACFRVIWGLYGTRAEAEQALKTMPPFFLQNASPRVASRPR